LLGVAHANTGADANAVDHLSAALAGDWLQWGPTLAEDGRLAKFFQTDKGKAVLALNEAYRKAFVEQAAAGLLVVARRSGFKRPEKPGKQYAASRGELYSYAIEGQRYLLLTHTGDAVIGFIESPSRDRIAYLWATQYVINPGGDNPFSNASVGVLDATTFLQIGKSARLKTEAVELMMFYAEGEELMLQTIEPNNLYSVAPDGGKLSESAGAQFADFETLYEMGQTDRTQPLLYATLEIARVLQPWGAVSKPANDLIVTRYEVKATRQTIALPSNGGKKLRRVTVSPDGSRTTFVGIGNACDGETDSALYIADTKTGSARLVHRGKGLGNVRWIDNKRFAFEAGKGEIAIYGVDEAQALSKIENRAGVALSALSNAVPSEHCPQPAKPAVDGIDEETGQPSEDGDTSDEDLEDGEVEDGAIDEGEIDPSEFED
jgi:hypothetical protein